MFYEPKAALVIRPLSSQLRGLFFCFSAASNFTLFFQTCEIKLGHTIDAKNERLKYKECSQH